MPRRKRSKKWISWLIILILLIAAGVVCYLVWDNYFNDDKEKNNEESSQVEEKESGNKGEEINEEISDNGEKVKQYDGEDPNQAEELSGVITYAGVQGSNLMIRINIDQYLENGQCELTLEKDSVVIYNDTADIVPNASTATCEGFDIPTGELEGGNIKIKINIKAGNKIGTINGGVNI